MCVHLEMHKYGQTTNVAEQTICARWHEECFLWAFGKVPYLIHYYDKYSHGFMDDSQSRQNHFFRLQEIII